MKTDSVRPYILICSRESALQKALASTIEDGGFKTLITSDIQEMFRLLEEYRPPVVILEDGLPKILEFELYEVIKRIERFKYIKIILISSTSYSLPEVDECIEIGRIEDMLLPNVRTFIEERDTSHISTEDPLVNTIAKPVKGNMGSVPSESEMKMHEEARRFAKIIVSDIVLYNRDKAEKGAREGTFYELLKKEIEEGRKFYGSRVSPTVLATRDYYDESIREFMSRVSRV